jgi:2-oxo-4-hydroxy-4-carboxy-5-ureidoimidazoline decarboxylase
MNQVLASWNVMTLDEAAEEILPCCGSKAWALEMSARRPISDENALMAASDAVWRRLTESDWLEAFRSHPRIGESSTSEASAVRSAGWSREEQGGVNTAGKELKQALAEGNRVYEQRFGRIFIVCATGKSCEEMLEILRRRLDNDEQIELQETAEQQRQIAQLRLRKWLHS